MTKPNTRPPDDESAVPRLSTIVTGFTDHAERLDLDQKTLLRIFELMQKVNEGTTIISQQANDAATLAVYHSEEANQQSRDFSDLTDALADLVAAERRTMDALERKVDSNAGAQGFVRNFINVYANQHPPTQADILRGMNPDKLTVAARDFMKVEEVIVLIGALLEAVPVPIIQHILDNAPLEDFTTAAKSTKRNRLSLVVDALLKATKRW